MKINIKCFAENAEQGTTGSELWNTSILSLSFMFVFTAYISIQNLQSSLNQEQGLGVISLSCLYAFIIISSISAPTILKFIGGKLAIIIPWVAHVLYTLSNFHPTFGTLVPASILIGLTAGPLWTSQGLYISTNSISLSTRKNKDLHAVLSKFNGIFFTMWETSQISGNLISSLVLNQGSYDVVYNKTQICGSEDCPLAVNATKIIEPERNLVYILLGIYLVFDIIGLLFAIFLLPPLPKSEWSEKQSVKTSVASCFSALGDVRLLLLIPFIAFMAMEQAILWTDFTKSFISCSFGIQKVGFVMATYGGATVGSALLWSRLAKFTGRYFLFAVASVINMGIFISLYVWTPNKEYYLYIIVVIWGISEGIWQTQSNALMTLLFKDKMETAFANYHGWKAIGFTTSFVTSNFLCTGVKLLMVMVLLAVSMVLYIIVEVVHHKNLKKEYIKVELKNNDEK